MKWTCFGLEVRVTVLSCQKEMIIICGAFNKFPDIFGQAFKIVIDSVCYCYSSYERTGQFL